MVIYVKENVRNVIARKNSGHFYNDKGLRSVVSWLVTLKSNVASSELRQ